MQHILYNIRFRNIVENGLLDVFVQNGVVTGSAILENANTFVANDIDIAVFCSKEMVDRFDSFVSDNILNANTMDFLNISLDAKLKDASQYIFDVLLSEQYCLYIKNNYRDSTFLSCYVRNSENLYNLLLMDEQNVFYEWQYATSQLLLHKDDPELLVKYNRVKFFEKCRKDFRRTLK